MQVWEVTAQLIGLAGSVGLLKAIEATGKPENVLYVWAVNQVFPCITLPSDSGHNHFSLLPFQARLLP